MRSLFAVDDEPVAHGAPLRPGSVAVLLDPLPVERGDAGAGTVLRYLVPRQVEVGAVAR